MHAKKPDMTGKGRKVIAAKSFSFPRINIITPENTVVQHFVNRCTLRGTGNYQSNNFYKIIGNCQQWAPLERIKIVCSRCRLFRSLILDQRPSNVTCS